MNHTFSRGWRDGFVERLHEGTWVGHVAEHVALQPQQPVGHDTRRGNTRQVKGERGRYNVICGHYNKSVRLAAGELAVRLINDLIVPRSNLLTSTKSWRASSSAVCAPRSGPRRRRSSRKPPVATFLTCGSTPLRSYSSASRASTMESRNGLIIVETLLAGRDHSCLVIDGKIAAIAERVPAGTSLATAW